MVTFNRHVGMTVEECYLRYENMIHNIAQQNVYALKNSNALSYEDIVQTAVVSFIKAYIDFNGDRGTKFSTFAHDRIKWELSRTLQKRYLVHFPDYYCYMWAIANKYNLTKKNMDELLKRKPKNMSKKSLVSAMEWLGFNAPTSLDATVTTDGEGKDKELYENVCGGTLDDTQVIVNDFLSILNEKERTVTKMLLDNKNRKEVAEGLNISQSQTYRIIQSIRDKWLAYTEEADV